MITVFQVDQKLEDIKNLYQPSLVVLDPFGTIKPGASTIIDQPPEMNAAKRLEAA